MIYLKKNDKLIIIIAIVVIIIAAIGLAAYNPPDDNITNDNDEMNLYDVSWETQTKTVTLDGGELYAGKNSKYSEEFTIGDENILKVTIEISWEDDSTYGILTTKGKDTLTADIMFNGATETWKSVRNGSKEFTYKINNMPANTTIEAESETIAITKLNEEYSIENSLTFNIDVKVQPGEKIFRLLKFLKDKGNDFMLDITYEYYYPTLSEDYMMESGEENDNGFDFNETGDYNPAYLGMLVNAGLTRW